MDINKSVKRACALKWLSQAEAADAAGMHQTQLSKITSNGSCQTRILERIAAGLGYKVSEFIALGED